MIRLPRLLSLDGRTSRRDFWLFTIGLAVVALGGHFAFVILASVGAPRVVGVLALLLYPLWLWAAGALLVRRAHDAGDDASLVGAAIFAIWLLSLLGFLRPLPREAPLWIAGALALAGYVYLGSRKGDVGPNRFDRPRTEPPTPVPSAPVDAAQLREQMQSMALPTWLLKPAGGAAFSKLGGKPELPATMDWPDGREHPRCFVAQLDLAEVRAANGPDWLPAEGRLYFFYDEDATDSLDLVACYASQEPAGPERSAPDGYEPDPMFEERRVGFERLISMPSLDWLGVLNQTGLADADFDELIEAPDKPFGDGPQHRIGGYASEIQSAQMELECEFRSRSVTPNYWQVPPAVAKGAEDWRLLLQVDSDDELAMNWIDTGRLYIFVRERDARKGDFSRTATIIQFY